MLKNDLISFFFFLTYGCPVFPAPWDFKVPHSGKYYMQIIKTEWCDKGKVKWLLEQVVGEHLSKEMTLIWVLNDRGRNQPCGQLRREESRGQAKSRNSHSVLEEGAEGRGGGERDGWGGGLEQRKLHPVRLYMPRQELGFWRLVGNLSEAFKQNDMICLEEHFSSDMETKTIKQWGSCNRLERMGVI